MTVTMSNDPCPAELKAECPLELVTHRSPNGTFACDQHGYRYDERAVVFLARKGGKILSITRGENKSDLALPGGKVERNDKSDWYAVVREVFEETGLAIADVMPIFTEWDAAGNPLIVTTFVGSIIGDDTLKASKEGVPAWVWPEALLTKSCTFREYNSKLFRSLGIVVE